jgi:hypothetical protein
VVGGRSVVLALIAPFFRRVFWCLEIVMSSVCACPSCGRRLRLPENVPDQTVCCPSCQHVFTPKVDSPTPLREAESGTPSPSFPRDEDEKRDAFGPERSSPDRGGRQDFAEELRHGQRPNRWDDQEEWRPRLPKTLPGKGLGVALVLLLGLSILVDILKTIVDASQLDAAGDEEAINVFDCVTPVILLPTAVLFAMWMYRSYKNLLDMDVRGLAYSPGWAAGAFFVPILNLYRPCQIAQEMWRASSPDLEEDKLRAWRHASGSAVVGFWWGFWIISNLLYNVSLRIAFSHHTAEARMGTMVGMMANGVAVLAGVCAILMVLGLRRRQEAKLDRLWELEK